MGQPAAVEATTADQFIFGNVHHTDVLLPDLETGPRDSRKAFKMIPGQVVDLEQYFSAARLRRSNGLQLAIEEGWLKPVKSMSSEVTPATRDFVQGEAPVNEFDEKLAELLDKEEAEEERMKSGRDPLSARARRTKEKS